MKRIFTLALALFCVASFGATLNPISLLNPAGSSSGQAIVSTGPTSAPAWGSLGSGSVSYTQGATGSVPRTITAKFQDAINVKDFGAKCDGSTDDSASITAAYTATPIGGQIDFPAATCAFASPLVFTSNKRVSLRGMGSKQTILLYKGASTTADLVTFGDGTIEEKGVRIEGIGFISSTVMTSGTAVHFKLESRMNLRDINVGDTDSANNLWNGIWFDGAANVTLNQFQAVAQNENFRVNGGPGTTTGPRADLFVSGGLITGGAVGIHIGGAFGGFYLDSTDVIANATNVLIDATLNTAGSNRETFFGAGVFLDSAGTVAAPHTGTNLDIEDTGGAIFLHNTWVASAANLIKVGSSFAGKLTLNGGILFNALTSYGGAGNAISNASSTAAIAVNGTRFSTINGTGVYSSVATTNIVVNHPIVESGVTVPIGANVGVTGLNDYTTNNAIFQGTVTVNGITTFAALPTISYPNALFVVNDSSGSGVSTISLRSSNVQYWNIQASGAHNLNISRYVSGSLVDNPISIANSNGLVSMPDGLSPSQTVGIVGTTTNNNANAGSVGEYVTNSTTATGATSGTTQNAATASLAAGDWDVQCTALFTPAGTTLMTNSLVGVSTVSATPGTFGTAVVVSSNAPAGFSQTLASPLVRESLASATTVYCPAQATFSTSTLTITGILRARRVR